MCRATWGEMEETAAGAYFERPSIEQKAVRQDRAQLSRTDLVDLRRSGTIYFQRSVRTSSIKDDLFSKDLSDLFDL